MKTKAATALANLTELQLRVTDEDRIRARETGGCIYDRVGKEYNAWWAENKERLRWNRERGLFLLF
jgi:hypothetical protein